MAVRVFQKMNGMYGTASAEMTATRILSGYNGTSIVRHTFSQNGLILDMEDQSRAEKLLEEIRDLQRENLEEYKRVTQQSLDMQKRAVERQEQVAKTYRIALIVSAILVVGIIALIFYLLQYFPARYR